MRKRGPKKKEIGSKREGQGGEGSRKRDVGTGLMPV